MTMCNDEAKPFVLGNSVCIPKAFSQKKDCERIKEAFQDEVNKSNIDSWIQYLRY